mgnify:FL=1|tara:strand:- start:1966 stop:2148 length:183 start_codon:yes stop_codon:yes gene_type:complete
MKTSETLTQQDYQVLAAVIDSATAKGLFRGGDLMTIGTLYKKVLSHLPAPTTPEINNDKK